MKNNPTTARAVLRAVLLGASIGGLVAACLVFAFVTALPDWVEQKYLSLRYRVAEYLPQSTPPPFVPTPIATLAVDERPKTENVQPSNLPTNQPSNSPTATAKPPARPTVIAQPPSSVLRPPASVTLRGIKHDYQRWNNCGPVTLSMYLSYFGRSDTQAEIAAFTKPNADDRNVRPDELTAYANRAGLKTLVRVNGTLDDLKLFLANGLPVIVETALVKDKQGWMGHYRLVTGYDAKQFSTMDSYDGPSVKLEYAELDDLWRAFNRLYLVIYPDERSSVVRAIVGAAIDDRAMYTQAVAVARAESEADTQDAFTQFNLGASLVGLKRYAEATTAFDRARNLGLPWRMLWYQFEPYEAYLNAKRYDEVIALANATLSVFDGIEEAHYYKGLALRAQGREQDARAAFQAALRYNKNFAAAQRAMTNDK